MYLTGEKLQDTARATALTLPGVNQGRPFTEHLEVYKVAGKVFLIVTDDPDELIVTLKAEPKFGRLLRSQYTSIAPGRYFDKRHWTRWEPAGESPRTWSLTSSTSPTNWSWRRFRAAAVQDDPANEWPP
jgi:predicted DNA-binding protein (MmcQ/YjbR family)